MSGTGSTPQPTVWCIRAGKGGRHASDFEELGVVAISFHPVGNVTGMSRDQIFDYVPSQLEEGTPSARGIVAGMLNRLVNRIEEGDYVIVPDGQTRELLLGEIIGPYEFRQPPVAGEFPHARRVRWLGRKSRDLLPKRILYSLGSTLTLFKPAGQEQLLALIQDRPVAEDMDVAGAGPDSDEDMPGSESELFADLQSRSNELIQARLAALDGYEMQDLVAGLLRAMGYFTTVSGPGADRGVDIVASRDPLAVDQPIKVQVKARPNSKTGPVDIRALAGVLTPGERGIFVSTGGFTREAEADATSRNIVLVDGVRIQELLLEYYDRLDQDTQSLVPLRRLYFPGDL